MMADAKSSLIRFLDRLAEDKVAAAESRARDYIKNFKAKATGIVQGSARPWSGREQDVVRVPKVAGYNLMLNCSAAVGGTK